MKRFVDFVDHHGFPSFDPQALTHYQMVWCWQAAFEGWFFGTANAGLDSVWEVDGFRSSMFFSGWSFWLIMKSFLPWSLAAQGPGNENVQSPSTSKVLKSIRGMANWNQNICQIAEASHRNRLFSIRKSFIYLQMEQTAAFCWLHTQFWLQMGHCPAMFVGQVHWCFAFNSQDAGVYSRFADIKVPAIYLCVCCV